MIVLVFILLLLVAAVCMGWSRRVPTRRLGLLAAGAPFVSALALLADQGWGLLPQAEPIVWADLDKITVYLTLQPDSQTFALALVLLVGGSLALLMLAVALSPTVRGFGSLFASALLTMTAALFGLSSNGILMPLSWALTVLFAYAAVRASGALAHYEEMHQSVSMGLLATLIMMGGVVAVESSVVAGNQPYAAAVILVVLASLLFVGSAPFHNTLSEFVLVPAALGALLYGVVMPVLGLGSLLRFVWVLTPATDGPPLVALLSAQKPLLLVGGVILVVCTAASLRERGLRRVLAWMAAAQSGAIIIATGLDSPLATLAAPALLVNLVFATLAGALAVAALEHLTGNDTFTEGMTERRGVQSSLRMPGLIWLLSALSALGLPPLWGFWGRFWLFQAAMEQEPWVAVALVASSGIAAIAYLAPLARFWWNEQPAPPAPTAPHKGGPIDPTSTAILALPIAPLLFLGIAPQLVWGGWLQGLPDAPALLPVDQTIQAVLIVVAVAGGLLLAMLWRLPWRRHTLTDEDMQPVVLAPDMLARSLSPLEWVGYPRSLLKALWNVLLLLNRGAHLALAIFEQRYYLTGVLLALISLILLMATVV